MTELDQFEAELRRLNPARPPEELMAKLSHAFPATPAPRFTQQSSVRPATAWFAWLRWLIPATVTIIVAMVWLNGRSPLAKALPKVQPPAPIIAKSIRADNVEFEENLLGSFEAVGHLPDGEPVRLRCREWEDGVVLRDTTRGVEIERRKPRLEVVQVSFETY